MPKNINLQDITRITIQCGSCPEKTCFDPREYASRSPDEDKCPHCNARWSIQGARIQRALDAIRLIITVPGEINAQITLETNNN